MADIELVIKIPKELYESNKGRPPKLGDAGMDMIAQSIANGVPLPEHHGRLIDADALLDKKQDYGEGQNTLILIDPYYVRKAPTVIEGSESE